MVALLVHGHATRASPLLAVAKQDLVAVFTKPAVADLAYGRIHLSLPLLLLLPSSPILCRADLRSTRPTRQHVCVRRHQQL